MYRKYRGMYVFEQFREKLHTIDKKKWTVIKRIWKRTTERIDDGSLTYYTYKGPIMALDER